MTLLPTPRRRARLLTGLAALDDRIAPASLPTGYIESSYASGLTNPTSMEFAPDDKLLICEQAGTMEVWQNGSRLNANFFAGSPLTVDSSGERGLLGVALDPEYTTNRFVYVHYTATTPVAHNRVSRFTANAAGTQVVPGSEFVVADFDDLSTATNHNGGAIQFGPDGKLYVTVGDNGASANAQTLENRFGKMLRINSDGSIPPDNPFAGIATGVNRAIWALGLRNPFTFSFQSGTGRMHINDVGQDAWEEINLGAAGANYGWPATEGNFDQASYPNFTRPFFAYGHTVGSEITGGAFYNPAVAQFPPDVVGDYFYADFGAGWIKRIDMQSATPTSIDFASNAGGPIDLHVDAEGGLYYLSRTGGVVSRIVVSPDFLPQITEQPSDRTVSEGMAAAFSVTVEGPAPFAYQWQRNGANIVGATSSSFTIPAAATTDNGALFRVIVANPFGQVTSSAATLIVDSNQPPVAALIEPVIGQRYNAGDYLAFSGIGTDPETGAVSVNGYTFQIDFHHGTHTHPFYPATSGISGGDVQIPTQGETAADVWYRVYLTVRDPQGLSTTVFRDVIPNVVTITIATNRNKLELNLDGQPTPAPKSFNGVVGILRNLEAPATQVAGGQTYYFDYWSDGEGRIHNFTTPAADITYTAVYRNQPPPKGGYLRG